MKRVAAISLVAGALVVVAVGSVCLVARTQASGSDREITVAAAASLTDVMPEIAAQFEQEHPGSHVRFTFGGSPQLVEQVIAGAPVDVLVTASESTMAKAADAGAVMNAKKVARNSMAIAVPAGNPGNVHSMNDLPKVSTVLCAPTVPCGQAAQSLLEKNGVTIKPTSLELDVRSALGKVIADEADAAIVYVTDVTAAGRSIDSVAIPVDRNVTTTYAAAAVSGSPNAADAGAFVDHLLTAPAQKALQSFGFLGMS